MLIAACLSVLAGAWLLISHVTTDPLADFRAYYDAAARLNRGELLYPPTAEGPASLYLYPPLVAILLRPIALLPYPVAAVLWETAVVAAAWLTVRRIGLGYRVRVALALLAVPMAWSLAIGQAEPIVMALLAVGSPMTVALAGHVKILPWLAAIYWVGRRDVRALRSFVAWTAAVGFLQLATEPAGTIAYLRLDWLPPAFGVRNLSPFAISPLLWLVMVAILIAAAVIRARSAAGWPLAVLLAAMTSPRLLSYQLITLLAGFGGPRDGHPAPGRSGGSQAEPDR